MNTEKKRRIWRGGLGWAVIFAALFCVASMMAQPAVLGAQSAPAVASPSLSNDEELTATREQLFKLLQMSPKLTGVVANDPSLLGDQEYVGRNNPELAKFLQNHPEIVRNPEFYLFANFGVRGKANLRLHVDRGTAWIDANRQPMDNTMREIVPVMVFVVIVGALLWMLRVLLENRRWSRLFNAQTGIYNKLLDRFSNNEELLAYVRDDAGKRFLESLALPSSLWSFSRSPITRILAPLQLGIVLTMAGIGLIWVRGSVPDATSALTGTLLIFGTLSLMLGIGFIISAGLSLLLARHLGLMSPAGSAHLQGNGGLETRERL